jgi:glyoxylase-like metal-dependent hydrolase (beta-lactamase superfamily II)
MKVEKFALGDIKSNCYLVSINKKAWIIDPAIEAPSVIEYLKNNEIEPLGIYITHGHFDHCGGIKYIKGFYDILAYGPIKDKVWFDLTPYNRLGYEVEIDVWVEEGMIIPFLDKHFTVYETPGHSNGSTALAIDNLLFVGDTLFYQSVGRTDLPFASQMEIYHSIKRLYKMFPDETICYPGHGRNTTIGHEKLYNPFVRK